ncbi:MAG: hypothetical protein ABI551_00345 [Polyangiaceae bacterium]
MTPRPSYLFAILAAAFVLPGCIPEHDGSWSNGNGGALYFEGVGTAGAAMATGFAVEVDIERYDSQWRACVISKSVGVGPHVAAVTSELSPQDLCSYNHEPIRVLDASCSDDTCSVSPLPDDGSGIAKVLVTGAHEGTSTLHVDVKSTGDDSTWGDDYPLTFAAPVRLALTTTGHYQQNGTRYASLPGAEFTWCPELLDLTGSVLAVDSTAFSNDAASAGSVIAADDASTHNATACASFHAQSPGTATVHFTAGSFSASHAVVIADPNAIAKVELRTVVEKSYADDSMYEVGSNGETEVVDAATTSITLYQDDYVGARFESVLTLKDGTLALGGGGAWKSSSDATVRVSATDYGISELAAEAISVQPMGHVIGDGQLTAAFGSLTATVPFHVLAGSDPNDGLDGGL